MFYIMFFKDCFLLLKFTFYLLLKWKFQYVFKYYYYYIIPIRFLWIKKLLNKEIVYKIEWKKIYFINNWPWWYAIKESFIDKAYLMHSKWNFFDFWWYIWDTSLARILYDEPKNIYIFEPQTGLIDIIRKNISSFSDIISKKKINVHIIHKAIWIKKWKIDMFLDNDLFFGDAWISYESYSWSKKIVCDVEKIQNYISKIDYLKMDIEWWEWSILDYRLHDFDFSIVKWKIDCHFYSIEQIDSNRSILYQFIKLLKNNNYIVNFNYQKDKAKKDIKLSHDKLSLLLEFEKNV